jgi:hypothetical protein
VFVSFILLISLWGVNTYCHWKQLCHDIMWEEHCADESDSAAVSGGLPSRIYDSIVTLHGQSHGRGISLKSALQ